VDEVLGAEVAAVEIEDDAVLAGELGRHRRSSGAASSLGHHIRCRARSGGETSGSAARGWSTDALATTRS
jgi:hypothetical protein